VFFLTQGLLRKKNIESAIANGEFDAHWPEGAAKQLVKAKFSKGGVTAADWNKFVNPIAVQRPEKTDTNSQSRPYNTYSDLANQHYLSQNPNRGHSAPTEQSCERESHAIVQEKHNKAESPAENNFIKRNTYINKFGDEVDCE